MKDRDEGMSSFMKATIVVFIGLVLLGTIVAVGGWMWWKKNKDNLMESTVKAREEGMKTGKDINEQQCLDLAVSKASKDVKFTQMIANGIFLGACLEESKASEGFCKDIPNDTDFMQTVKWRKKKCDELGLEQNACSGLLSVVQRYCHYDRKRLGK